MKKIISLLCAAFVLVSSVSTLAFYDIDDVDVESAVEELSSFDIINGYNDGSFRPDNYITRAEFSKIIVAACGYTYNGYDDNLRFYDVNSSDWFKDYVYIAKSLDIVNGVDDVNFEPNSNITYEQAIKMIVAALGYNDEATNQGGYPNGYISVANVLGITNGVNYRNTNKATRGDIALMVYNALYAECYTIWNDNGTVKRQMSDITLYEKHTAVKNVVENGGISSGDESDVSSEENAVG